MLCYLSEKQQYDQLVANQATFAIYKYNDRGCRISERTIRELLQASAEQGLRHLYMVDIIKHKDLSEHISQSTEIKHESPQLLVFNQGKVVAHTSHMHITANYLLQHFPH